MKEEIRILGIDDGYFKKYIDKETILIGIITRGAKQVDGVLSSKITVNGNDSTDKIIEMVKRTKHYDQLKIIMTNGITFAGFNLLDLNKLYESLKLPVVAVVRKKPNMERFLKALEKIDNNGKMIEIVKGLPEPKPVKTKYGITYYQAVGLSDKECEELILKTSVNSRIPEPVRIAHLVAMGVTLGYSKGKP